MPRRTGKHVSPLLPLLPAPPSPSHPSSARLPLPPLRHYARTILILSKHRNTVRRFAPRREGKIRMKRFRVWRDDPLRCSPINFQQVSRRLNFVENSTSLCLVTRDTRPLRRELFLFLPKWNEVLQRAATIWVWRERVPLFNHRPPDAGSLSLKYFRNLWTERLKTLFDGINQVFIGDLCSER